MSAPDEAAPARPAAREVTLARARALARHGRYAEAAGLLDRLLGDEPPSGAGPSGAGVTTAAALDLRARVHAQQGQLDQADHCWAEAERLAPGGAEYAAGRRRIAAIRARGDRRGSTRLALRAGGVVAAALALALLIDIRFAVGGSTGPTAPGEASPARGAGPSASASAPSTATPAGRASSPAGLLDVADLQVPGAQLRRLPGQVSVTFTSGVFSGQTSFSASGRTALALLGARLRPYAARVSVAIVGYTDDLPAPPGTGYADNFELGLLRAQAARAYLSAVSGIPLAMLPVSSMGDEQLPFPDPSGTAQPRDRTVTLWISATGED